MPDVALAAVQPGEARTRKISLAFCDFPGSPFNSQQLLRILRRLYEVVTDDPAPDYVIYSVFGYDFMRHKDAVRIFFAGENVKPDFNLCDYAFAFDWIEFGDRYFRAPNFVLYDQYREIYARQQTVGDPALARREKFCNFIYSNPNSHPIRDEFFRRLCRYKKVDSVGGHLNNVGAQLGSYHKGDWSGDKIRLQSQYKFTIAFENSSSPGYTTEKIVHALAADTIPIYWGDPEIGRVFNKERFVQVSESSIDEAVETVRRLDTDDQAYLAMISKPFFADGRPPASLCDDALLAQFAHIFDQPKTAAFRRNFHFWGRIYEDRRRSEVAVARYLVQPRRRARKIKRFCEQLIKSAKGARGR